MKSKLTLAVGLSALLLAVLACGPLTATPSSLPPSPATVTLAPSATAKASATPTQEPTLAEPTWPATPSVPQPAATPSLHAGAAVTLDEIHMMSLTTGWGVSGPYVLVTADGGTTWREVTPPADTSSGIPDKAYGAFLDAQTAWVVFSSSNQIVHQAQVWHTTDGGATWTPSVPLLHQAYGDQVWAEFAVLDAQNVWLLVRGVYVGAGTHYDHELFHTADGGLTWTSLDGQISDDYTGLAFADASFGLRTLQTVGNYGPAPAAYETTTDGGANWTNYELPAPAGVPDLFTQYDNCETYQPILLSAQSIRMLVACFDYFNPPHQFISYLYSSPDGGTTWSEVLLQNKVLASQDTLIYFGQDNALLLGHEIYRSTDGGQTWQHLSSVNWDGQFSFVDQQHGWAVVHLNGQAGLVKTTSGGASWVLIQPVIGG